MIKRLPLDRLVWPNVQSGIYFAVKFGYNFLSHEISMVDLAPRSSPQNHGVRKKIWGFIVPNKVKKNCFGELVKIPFLPKLIWFAGKF